MLAEFAAAGVTVHGDARVAAYSDAVVPATEEDWGTEYLSADISVAVVDSLDDALDHIRRYGTGHTEAIVTESLTAARAFRGPGGRGRGDGQRVDPVHRRRRVRLRRRDRHLHPEAARPRPDGPARADLDQIRRDRQRPHPR